MEVFCLNPTRPVQNNTARVELRHFRKCLNPTRVEVLIVCHCICGAIYAVMDSMSDKELLHHTPNNPNLKTSSLVKRI